MKLDELRTVQSKERRKDSLQQLRDCFYEDVAAYLQDLKASRDRRAQQVDDPFSDDEVRQLSDELDTATEVAEAVYERRVGKVVKLASFAAADMPVDDEGMTSEERRLFDDLVGRIEQNKRSVLDVLSGSGDGGDAETASQPTDAEPTPPPSPTDRIGESAAADAADAVDATDAVEAADAGGDGMLADAMGGGSEPAAGRDTQPAHSAAESADESATDNESADPTPEEVPPPEAEPEAEAVIEPSTDGGTTTDAAADVRSNGGPAASQSPADQASADQASAEGPATPPAANGTPESTSSHSGSASEADDEERTTLRITKNVGEIFCVDGREYTLRSEDVVTLPTTNAEPLVDRDAAMRLD